MRSISDGPDRGETPQAGDDATPGDGRDETENEQLDRNWNEILQELRVTQTGTQIFTGFLLAAAFQNRFTDLDAFQIDVYLVLVVTAVLTTALGLAPVSLHRVLFRRGAKKQIVRLANLAMNATLICIAALLTGTVLLVFDIATARPVAITAASAVLALIVLLWVLVPATVRTRIMRASDTDDDDSAPRRR
jgi:hypothetical protein